MRNSQSNLAIEGFWASQPATALGACYTGTSDAGANVHHLAFINDIASGCDLAGFDTYSYQTNVANGSYDQTAAVGVISYNGAQSESGAGNCSSCWGLHTTRLRNRSHPSRRYHHWSMGNSRPYPSFLHQNSHRRLVVISGQRNDNIATIHRMIRRHPRRRWRKSVIAVSSAIRLCRQIIKMQRRECEIAVTRLINLDRNDCVSKTQRGNWENDTQERNIFLLLSVIAATADLHGSQRIIMKELPSEQVNPA